MTIELNTLGAVIKSTYEAEPDTNAFTDADKAKLATVQDRANHTGTQSAATIYDLPDLLSGKIDAVPGKQLTEAEFTQAEKIKLAALESSKFKGGYISLAALQLEHPTSDPGDLAIVDEGEGGVNWYSWDAATAQWTVRVGDSVEITPAQVRQYLLDNPDTNILSDSEKQGLLRLISANRYTLSRLGTWNAATNTPELQNGTGNSGDWYYVSTAGSRDFGTGSFNFVEGDRVEYSGGVWQRVATNPPAPPVRRGTIPAAIPAMRRISASAQSMPTSVYTKIASWAGAGYDQFGIHASGDITIPAWARFARITAQITYVAGATANVFAAVYRNNVRVARCGGAVALGTAAAYVDTGVIEVTGGQVFDIRSWHSKGEADTLTAQESWVNVELYE